MRRKLKPPWRHLWRQPPAKLFVICIVRHPTIMGNEVEKRCRFPSSTTMQLPSWQQKDSRTVLGAAAAQWPVGYRIELSLHFLCDCKLTRYEDML